MRNHICPIGSKTFQFGNKKKLFSHFATSLPMGSARDLSAAEVSAAKALRAEGFSLRAIARRLGRSFSSVGKLLKRRKPPARGRPAALSSRAETAFLRHLRKMQEKADGAYEATARMAAEKWKGKVSLRSAQRLLQRRGVKWRALRSKPRLTSGDVDDRRVFATRWGGRPESFWRNIVALDGKVFTVVLKPEDRRWAAAGRVRGAYRGRDSGLSRCFVKKKVKERQPAGGSLFIIGAVCGPEQHVFWHAVSGRWCGAAAADMYQKLRAFLWAKYPGRRRWRILEDNDPVGLQCGAARRAKRDLGMTALPAPKRSPGLSLMDYAAWSEIQRRMRESERRMRRPETSAAFSRRLRRVATSLPKSFLARAQGSMRRRLQQLKLARGAFFEE